MKKLSLLFGAVIIAVAGLVSSPTKQVSADTSWQPEVLVSSAQVRFEAQATGYDSATNKYKYKFSWLMPKGKTYSIKIDGNMYQPSVTQNAVIETPFWFSPDITYTIQIHPYANGRGNVIGQGTFKAPSAPKPALTIEEEAELLFDTISLQEDIPTRTVKSPEDVKKILALGLAIKDIEKLSDARPYLSQKSIGLLDQIPLLASEMDNAESKTEDITRYTDNRVTVYKGLKYASIKTTSKDLETGEKEIVKVIFIKENGSWKIDLLQTFYELYKEDFLS